jgi:cytochrome c553
MQKVLIGIILFTTIVVFQYCTSSKKASSATPAALTYENNIRTVIETSCSPCHIAGKGNKKPLDSYVAASGTIDDIIARIQKNPGERGFMPSMHSKLSDSTIHLFVQWKSAGMKEK